MLSAGWLIYTSVPAFEAKVIEARVDAGDDFTVTLDFDISYLGRTLDEIEQDHEVAIDGSCDFGPYKADVFDRAGSRLRLAVTAGEDSEDVSCDLLASVNVYRSGLWLSAPLDAGSTGLRRLFSSDAASSEMSVNPRQLLEETDLSSLSSFFSRVKAVYEGTEEMSGLYDYLKEWYEGAKPEITVDNLSLEVKGHFANSVARFLDGAPLYLKAEVAYAEKRLGGMATAHIDSPVDVTYDLLSAPMSLTLAVTDAKQFAAHTVATKKALSFQMQGESSALRRLFGHTHSVAMKDMAVTVNEEVYWGADEDWKNLKVPGFAAVSKGPTSVELRGPSGEVLVHADWEEAWKANAFDLNGRMLLQAYASDDEVSVYDSVGPVFQADVSREGRTRRLRMAAPAARRLQRAGGDVDPKVVLTTSLETAVEDYKQWDAWLEAGTIPGIEESLGMPLDSLPENVPMMLEQQMDPESPEFQELQAGLAELAPLMGEAALNFTILVEQLPAIAMGASAQVAATIAEFTANITGPMEVFMEAYAQGPSPAINTIIDMLVTNDVTVELTLPDEACSEECPSSIAITGLPPIPGAVNATEGLWALTLAGTGAGELAGPSVELTTSGADFMGMGDFTFKWSSVTYCYVMGWEISFDAMPIFIVEPTYGTNAGVLHSEAGTEPVEETHFAVMTAGLLPGLFFAVNETHAVLEEGMSQTLMFTFGTGDMSSVGRANESFQTVNVYMHNGMNKVYPWTDSATGDYGNIEISYSVQSTPLAGLSWEWDGFHNPEDYSQSLRAYAGPAEATLTVDFNAAEETGVVSASLDSGDDSLTSTFDGDMFAQTLAFVWSQRVAGSQRIDISYSASPEAFEMSHVQQVEMEDGELANIFSLFAQISMDYTYSLNLEMNLDGMLEIGWSMVDDGNGWTNLYTLNVPAAGMWLHMGSALEYATGDFVDVNMLSLIPGVDDDSVYYPLPDPQPIQLAEGASVTVNEDLRAKAWGYSMNPPDASRHMIFELLNSATNLVINFQQKGEQESFMYTQGISIEGAEAFERRLQGEETERTFLQRAFGPKMMFLEQLQKGVTGAGRMLQEDPVVGLTLLQTFYHGVGDDLESAFENNAYVDTAGKADWKLDVAGTGRVVNLEANAAYSHFHLDLMESVALTINSEGVTYKDPTGTEITVTMGQGSISSSIVAGPAMVQMIAGMLSGGGETDMIAESGDERRLQEDMEGPTIKISMDMYFEDATGVIVVHELYGEEVASTTTVNFGLAGADGGVELIGTIDMENSEGTQNMPFSAKGVFKDNIICFDGDLAGMPFLSDVAGYETYAFANGFASGMSGGAMLWIHGDPFPGHVMELGDALVEQRFFISTNALALPCAEDGSFNEEAPMLNVVDMEGDTFPIGLLLSCSGERPEYPPFSMDEAYLPMYLGQVAEILFPPCEGPECDPEDHGEDEHDHDDHDDDDDKDDHDDHDDHDDDDDKKDEDDHDDHDDHDDDEEDEEDEKDDDDHHDHHGHHQDNSNKEEPAMVREAVATVEATLEIDLSAVDLEVDLTDPPTASELEDLSEEAKDEVMQFASDVADSYAEAVADSLDVDAASVTVQCVYLVADPAQLDLLELDGGSCKEGRRLSSSRRLAGDGIGLIVEMVGEAQEAVSEMMDEEGTSALTETLQAMDVVIESDLVEGGSLEAVVAEVAEPKFEIVEVPMVDTTTPPPPPPSGVESSALAHSFIALLALTIFG
jgi:hypothetical protein